MKKHVQRILLSLLLIPISGLLTAQTNLLPAGFFDFEDPNGWWINPASQPYVSVTDDRAATGTNSLKFDFPDYDPLSDGTTSVAAQSSENQGAKVDLTAGTYYIKIMVFIEGNPPPEVKTIFQDGWIQVNWNLAEIEHGKWVELLQTVTLPNDIVDGALLVQVFQSAFAGKEGSGSFYVDDIEVFEPFDLGPSDIMNLNHFSFEGGSSSWWIPPASRPYVGINHLQAASGFFAMQYSFDDYSIVSGKVHIMAESRGESGLINFESGKEYEIKIKFFMEDEPDFVLPGRIQTNIKAAGGSGYQTILWDLNDVSQRGEWVELTQVIEYAGSNLSPGEIVSRELVLRIPNNHFPETGKGTFYVDDISIKEALPRYQVNLAVEPVEIAADVNVQGAGDYAEGTEVQISASAVDGYDFAGWTGSAEDVTLLVDATSLVTTLIMPARTVTLTATYEEDDDEEITYHVNLEVDPAEITADANLQGAGYYTEGAEVEIAASAVEGYDFIGWTGTVEDVALLADASSLETSFIMPARTVSLTATYEVEETYRLDLAVNPVEIANDANLQGAGEYSEDSVVQIAASEVDGYLFTGWTGSKEDVALLADVSSLETSFTMPGRGISFTAVFSSTTYIAGREMPEIRVYPVPATEIITIETTEMIHHIRIIDVSGRTLSNHIVNDRKKQLSVDHLLPGQYFVQVVTSDKSLVLPIQVVRQ